MSDEPQVHQSFGSVLLSVFITLIIVGCAGFIFYSITKQQKPDQDAIQAKLEELKAEVGTNQELKDKIKALEEKIDDLNETDNEEEVIDTIDTENWKSLSNEFFKISMKYPEEFKMCLNEECDNDVKDIEADYWEISNGPDAMMIFPRINKLNELAVEFGQKTFSYNKDSENVIIGSDAIGVFNKQLAYQFDVNDVFVEKDVSIDENYYLTYDEDSEPSEYLFKNPHRIIYFDYDGFIYRIIYPTNKPIFDKIIEEVNFELLEDKDNVE